MNKIIKNPISLLMIPGYLYFFTYIIEVGFCSFYEIPLELILIDNRHMSVLVFYLIASIFILLCIGFYLDKIFFYLIPKEKKKDIKFNIKVSINILFLLFSLSPLIIIYVFKIESLFGKIMFSIFSVFIFINILYIIYFENTKNKTDYHENDYTKYSFFSNSKGFYENFYGNIFVSILVFSFIGTSLSYQYGYNRAENQKIFYEAVEHKEYSGLTIYGDNLILKNKNNKDKNKIFKILKISEISELRIVHIN